MTTYRAKVNHNVALVSLTTLDPQPRSEGVKPTRRDYANDGTVIDQGLYVELVWDILDDATAYTTILGVFGLTSAKSADVTIYARNDQYAWTRYNGKAIRPEPSWNQFFPRNVVILVRDLVAL